MPPRGTKIEGDRFEKAVNAGSRAVDASESSPVERRTTSGDNPGVERKKRFSRRQVVQGLSVAGVVGIAGCLGSGDDDEGDGGGSDDGADDGSASDDETDSAEADDTDEDSNGTDDDGDDADDETDDTSEADGEDEGNTTAEITFLGETHTSSGSEVGCFDGATEDVSKQLLATFESDRHVGLQITSTFYDGFVNVFLDGIDSSSFDDDHDGPDRAQYAKDIDFDEIAFDIDGEENFASGTVHLDPYNPAAREVSPDGIDVEFDIRCGPGSQNGNETDEESADAADDVDDEIDPSGVTTAVGKLERVESGIDPGAEEVPIGEFEFGARYQGGWDENWGES